MLLSTQKIFVQNLKKEKMEIIGTDKKLNFDEKLRPLFEAMKEGKKIKSITCMGGSDAENDRSKDFEIIDLIATQYFIDAQQNFDGSKKLDCVVGTNNERFYMSWVLSFEL